MKISLVFLFYILGKKVGSNVSLVSPLGLYSVLVCSQAQQTGSSSKLHLLLDYKLTLSKSNIKNTIFMGLEVFAMGVQKFLTLCFHTEVVFRTLKLITTKLKLVYKLITDS